MEPSYECIKHLIFREEPEEIKFPLYRSKFSAKVREEVKRSKMCHRSMGFPSEFPRTPPEDFLKKRSRMVRRPDLGDVTKPSAFPSSRIPTRADWYKRPDRQPTNFILKNIRDAVHSVPKEGPFRQYDTAFCRRIKHRVFCIPRFVVREGYGKVPKYILQKNEEKKRKEEELEKQRREAVEEPICRLIPSEEREQLLDGLKNTWAEMQKEFQLLPMLNDTPPKIKRKAKLEKELIELENDIKLVESYQRIYVCNSERMMQKWNKGKEEKTCKEHLAGRKCNDTACVKCK